jgi:hypothetical protein
MTRTVVKRKVKGAVLIGLRVVASQWLHHFMLCHGAGAVLVTQVH